MIITLTAGGIETRIIHEVCNFESFELLEDESGRAMLRQIYQSYANVAVCYGLPFQHPDMAGCGTDQRNIEALAKGRPSLA